MTATFQLKIAAMGVALTLPLLTQARDVTNFEAQIDITQSSTRAPHWLCSAKTEAKVTEYSTKRNGDAAARVRAKFNDKPGNPFEFSVDFDRDLTVLDVIVTQSCTQDITYRGICHDNDYDKFGLPLAHFCAKTDTDVIELSWTCKVTEFSRDEAGSQAIRCTPGTPAKNWYTQEPGDSGFGRPADRITTMENELTSTQGQTEVTLTIDAR